MGEFHLESEVSIICIEAEPKMVGEGSGAGLEEHLEGRNSAC